MIEKNTDIQIDINSIDKINLFKVPFDSHKVINITNHIKKKLSILDFEKEKLQNVSSFEKKKNTFEIQRTKNSRIEGLKRKTKKSKKIRPFTNILKKSSLTKLYSQLSSKNNSKLFNLKRISMNKSQKQLSLFDKKNSPKKNKDIFITESNKKPSLLHLTSNFSRNNSELNVMQFNGFSNTNSFSSENIHIISNTSNSISYNFNELCLDLNNNTSNNNINNISDNMINNYNNNNYNNNNLNQENSLMYNFKIKKRNIPHPIYKHLNETLENSKKIKNEIMNLSNSYSQNNSCNTSFNNTDNNINYYEKTLPLERKEKYFIYNLGYYLFLDPKYKDSLSSTKTVSLLNPISSFIFKDKIEKKMEIKIKYVPLDNFKIISDKAYDYKYQKPSWVEKKNIQLNKGFKNIYKQLEKNKLDLKKLKKKHNF